jgi:uncharacterized protein (TIGR04255 family)
MSRTPDFANPPIVELVLGAQFSPLTRLTSGHFGLFWKELGDDWTDPSDAPLIEEQYELFDRPQIGTPGGLQVRLEPVRLPGRFTISHKSRDRLLQIQTTRFHLNWRKQDHSYPSYKRLIAEFEELFARFSLFARRLALGQLAVNQWELTYIDSFPKGDYWNTAADWPMFLPGLFGQLFSAEGLRIVLENRAAEWSYVIEPKRGRLHIAAGPGWWQGDKRQALLLQMTARGPVGEGGTETLRAGLDVGHDIAVGTFLRVVSEATINRWGVAR